LQFIKMEKNVRVNESKIKKQLNAAQSKMHSFCRNRGIGMSGIAEVLVNLGYHISGSDVQPSETTARLQKIGAKVVIGHAAENIDNADVVVTSTAVKSDNPEVREAHRKNIPVIPRAEMLAELLKMKFSVAFPAATQNHDHINDFHNPCTRRFRSTMVIGGKLASIGSNARLGDGEIIVAEADESDGSFLKLSPTIAVITNIDREHLDFYPGITEIKERFLSLPISFPFTAVRLFAAIIYTCGRLLRWSNVR